MATAGSAANADAAHREPEPAVSARSGTTRFPGFDGLRALAAIAVLLTHASFSAGASSQHALGPLFSRMDGGVAVFFVLSGFLLYRPFLLARIRDRPHPGTGSYLWRRVLRIYPAYWLVLIVVVYVFGDKGIDDARSFFLFFSLTHIYDINEPLHAFGPLVQSWTLATEVAFYIFLPIWALVVRQVSRRAQGAARLRGELIGIGVLVAVSVAWKAFVLSAGFAPGRVGQLKLWLPWWLDLFAFGMLIAIGSIAVTELGRRTPLRLDHKWAPAACWTGAVGAFVLVAWGVGLPHASPDIENHLLWGQHYLYGLTAVLLVLPAVFGPQTRESSRVRWFLTTRVMVYLGVISYGIYLWHEALIDRYLSLAGFFDPGQISFNLYGSDVPFRWHTGQWMSVPWYTFVLAVFAATVVCASISWFCLERPALRLKDLPRRLRNRS